MSTFTWSVDANPTQTKKPQVNNIKFGDGYEQRVRHGINTNPQVWELSFANRDASEATAIDNFLDSMGGVTAFDWTPPGGNVALKFKCQSWNKVPGNGNMYSITATFEQVFDP
jgi:phage-related protein